MGGREENDGGEGVKVGELGCVIFITMIGMFEI